MCNVLKLELSLGSDWVPIRRNMSLLGKADTSEILKDQPACFLNPGTYSGGKPSWKSELCQRAVGVGEVCPAGIRKVTFRHIH